jgi:hypothetical protein
LSISSMQPGDHACGFYSDDEDQRAVALEFVRGALERREKLLYIVNLTSAAELLRQLREGGVDADALVKSGQLVILTAKDAYLKGGEFDPDRMVAMLEAETSRALEEGWEGLRATAEMTWALAGEPGSERLIEYEAKVNRFLAGSRATALCQYDRRRFDSEVLLDVLHTHPKVLVDREQHDNENMYYVPPDAFFGADRRGAILDRWVDNLRGRAGGGR